MDKFIAGSGGGGKGGGGGSRTPSTDPDSLNSRSFGHIVDLISEGEIAGLVDDGFVNPIPGATDAWMRSIFLDNTPLKNADGTVNFDDVIVRVEHGTANQPVLPGFEKASNIINNTQSGVEIDATGQQFDITDASTDQVLFLLSVPQLQKIKNNGDTEGTEFKFKFQKSTNNGAFQDFSVNGTVDQTIKGRTADLYQKQYVFDLSADTFPVRFKVIRTSGTDTTFMNDNDGFISHVSKFYVTSHTLIKHQASDLSGTYTHNNGSGGAGTLITITSSTPHLLEVGDSIGCEFNNSDNTRLIITTLDATNPAIKFQAQHTQSANTSGTVTFGQRFNYPNSAVLGLRIDAEQFNSVPKRSYLIKGIKVKIPNGVTVDPNNGRIIYPINYVFNGTLGAAQWTTDPA
jgi:predicted phage tail protein